MQSDQSPGKKLRNLLASGETILLPGCADPLSARIFERMGFKALSVGGWMSGANMATPEPLLSLSEQVAMARRVARAVNIPVRADAHTGFGEPMHIMRTVREFEDAGVAAIHLEDQVFPKRASYHRGLEHVCELDEFLRRIEYALKARRDDNFMIVARTDSGNAYNGSWKEAARRVRAVRAMGIEMALPHVRTRAEIEQFRQEFPDNDMVLSIAGYFNGLTPEQFRAYGFQVISYPLATVIAQMAGTIKDFRALRSSGRLSMDANRVREIREEIEAAQEFEQSLKIERATVEPDGTDDLAGSAVRAAGAETRTNP